MALINCPECKREISNSAINCPNCGTPVLLIENEEHWIMPFIKQVLIGSFMVFLLLFVFENRDNATLIVILAYFPIWYFTKIFSILDKILPILFYLFIFSKDTARNIDVLNNFFGF